MSAIINVHEAKTNFSKLVDRAHAGEEIVIAKAGKPYARLVKLSDAPRVKRTPGGWPELGPLCDDAVMSPMTSADLDTWERKFDDL